jgi:tetratricopeptide (TPR) repeat protein
LLEWRTAVDLQPLLLRPVLAELQRKGARAEELASLGASNPKLMLEVVDYVSQRGRLSDAVVALNQAEAAGAPRGETLLSRASLELDAGNIDAAANAAAGAAATGMQDPRLAILQARILLKQRQAEGADEALALLDRAAARYPTDLAVQRERVALVSRYKKWASAARAIDGLQFACYHAGGSASEAHVAAAEIALDMGRINEALGEYRMALVDRPNDVEIWLAYGHAADRAGRRATAREAYDQAARLSPNNPVIIQALKGLDDDAERRRALQAAGAGYPPTPER